jgi:predicted metal-binding membrane protein
MPLAFLMRRGGFRRDVPGCLLLGLRHGAYCVGCCWALMALLLGVTNLLWMVLLSLLVFLEKTTSVGRRIAAVGGMVLVAAGAWLLLMGTP